MELVRFPSHRGFSVRSIFTFALAVITAVLLWAIMAAPPVAAADATWTGGSLEYEGNKYTLVGEAKEGDSIGLPAGTTYYLYVDNTSSPAPSVRKAHVIYFAPGADPPATATATHAVYDYSSTNAYSNPTEVTSITIDVSTANTTSTPCAIEGIGWIVCPVMNFLADGMDAIFNLLAGFMEVQPLQTGNTQGALYNAWNIMRAIANIAFIIVFIIIIYAQLSNLQVNNYGIKRMLPRLIIAAIAVNVSYIICALAVDLSNILGHSLQQIFLNIRDQILATGTADPAALAALGDWKSVTAFIISGGTAGAALGIAGVSTLMATGASALSLVFILLPAMVGLLMAILVVLLILAARQAIIVILTIIAPLAMVAYLLPNTEKWFGKWRDLFMTMLIFFPAFSVVFGGSQLAGAAIIQNANSINMIVLGMIVQVAPLVITPLILKFGGGLLGNIARLVNNPNKGIIDRTRNWSKPRAEWNAKRNREGLDRNGNVRQDKNGKVINDGKGQDGLRRREVLRRSARYLDQRKKRLSDRTTNADTASQTNYENSVLYAKDYKVGKNKGQSKYNMAEQKAYFEDRKNENHSKHAEHLDKVRQNPNSLLAKSYVGAATAKDNADYAQAQTTNLYNRARSDKAFAATIGASALHDSSYKVASMKYDTQAADNALKEYYNKERATVGSVMNVSSVKADGSEITVKASEDNYAAYVEDLKLPGGALNVVAKNAQASKEHLESAQNRLQKYFNEQRTTENGNVLNVSTKNLTQSKVQLDRSQSDAEAYIQTIKARQGTSLHWDTVAADVAKRDAQLAEGKLGRMLDEYRAGGELDAATGQTLINGVPVSAAESILLNDLAMQTEDLAAEARGTQAAQNMQKKRIAEAFRATTIDPTTGKSTGIKTQRAQDLLAIARSIDPAGDVRAEADAITTLERIIADARGANESLIEERAIESGLMPKDYAVKLLEDRLGGDMSESEDIIRAAMEIAGKEAQIPVLRKIRRDTTHFNQEHFTSMILRNNGLMKAKGAFDLQANLGLIGASEEVMNASIADTMGSTAPDKFYDLKNGTLKDYVANYKKHIIPDTLKLAALPEDTDEGQAGRRGLVGLRKTYANLHTALNDAEIVRSMGDNLSPAIKMYRMLNKEFQDSDKNLEDSYLNGIDPEYIPRP